MTTTRTVGGLSRLLVLVPVTVCATISYVNEELPRCQDRKPPPQALGKCRYDEDCVENAYCWSQESCHCKHEYILYKNRTHVYCLKAAQSIGDSCVADVQCQVTFAPHSECQENICQCSAGSRFAEGRCYETVGLGQVCQTHHNCYLEDSFCVSGYCACNLQHHPSSDNSRCLKSMHLGDSCLYDDECVTKNSRCNERCVCNLDYVQSSDGQRCLKAANSVGEHCEEDSQCTEFLHHSLCTNNHCTCKENYHRRGSVCLRDVALGDPCLQHEQCVTPKYIHSNSTDVINVDCINGKCSCARDYMMIDSTETKDCVPFTDVSAATSLQAFSILLSVLLVNF